MRLHNFIAAGILWGLIVFVSVFLFSSHSCG